MTITATESKANTQVADQRKSGWDDPFGADEDCRVPRTWYGNNGTVRWGLVHCHRLSCPKCGTEKREAEYEKWVRAFFCEPTEVYAVEVPAHKVDHLRKYAARRGHPILSVPIAEDCNVVFSPFRFEGSTIYKDPDYRRVFLELRVSKRQIGPSGRWATKRPGGKGKSASVILSKSASRQAFEKVAEQLETKVIEGVSESYFHDRGKLGPETIKVMLERAEEDLRIERMRSRGIEVKRRTRWRMAA